MGRRGNYCQVLVGQPEDHTGIYGRMTGLLMWIIHIRLGTISGSSGNRELTLSTGQKQPESVLHVLVPTLRILGPSSSLLHQFSRIAARTSKLVQQFPRVL